jgi:membrane protein insertase Oxa1/YidC/SpoIIIJ
MSVLLFPLFLYNGPSGLNLYILTSTTIGIIESKSIRKHIKEREEAEKAGRIIVDAAPSRRKRGGSGAGPSTELATPKKTGFMAKIAELQQRLEQMRREAERKGK